MPPLVSAEAAGGGGVRRLPAAWTPCACWSCWISGAGKRGPASPRPILTTVSAGRRATGTKSLSGTGVPPGASILSPGLPTWPPWRRKRAGPWRRPPERPIRLSAPDGQRAGALYPDLHRPPRRRQRRDGPFESAPGHRPGGTAGNSPPARRYFPPAAASPAGGAGGLCRRKPHPPRGGRHQRRRGRRRPELSPPGDPAPSAHVEPQSSGAHRRRRRPAVGAGRRTGGVDGAVFAPCFRSAGAGDGPGWEIWRRYRSSCCPGCCWECWTCWAQDARMWEPFI